MPGTEIQLKFSGAPITRVAIGNSQNNGMRDYQEDSFGFSQLDKASVSANGFAAVVADENPRKTALTHYIGDSSAVLAETNVRVFLPLNGDKLLICSDGVYNALEESELAQIMKASPQEAAEHIVSAVLSKGYVDQDNFTSVILGFSES